MIAIVALPLVVRADAGSPRFALIEPESYRATFVPRSLQKDALVTVVLKMSGDPLAAVVSRSADRSISAADRDTTLAVSRAQHASVEPHVRAAGGKVLARLQHALNGVKIQVPRSKLAGLASLPGVIAVLPVGTHELNNTTSVPLIGAPAVWSGLPGFRGEGVKIGIIDTGIDYTHADFGGPGTVAAFTAAKAAGTEAPDPALFGCATCKVKGGIDLVGDAYTGSNAPAPDANPLDCNGHGTHVAGTATGLGVTAAGATYRGPYDESIYTPGAFSIGPGVAPKADLYSIRVFGCTGSTNVVDEAIDWGVANHLDVLSLSLGANFGATSSAESEAVANALAAGVIVVAASGNANQVPYITSAPAIGDGAISVAATDALSAIPTATLALDNRKTLTVQNSNGAVIEAGSLGVVILRNPDGTVSLGCDDAEYDKTRNGGIDLAGKLVITSRGTCARVFRAGAAQHYGAAAAALINTVAGFPVYEGPIPGNDPLTNPYEPVTIPFFGIALADKSSVIGAPAATPAIAVPTSAAVAVSVPIANPGFEKVASFSSSGPRIGDSVLKPGVTAPGVSTVSAASGTGNGFIIESGTSMATPHVAGVAALVRQAKPKWGVREQVAAIVQTANPALMKDYLPLNEGSGLVQAAAAVSTQVVAIAKNDSLSFGYADLLRDFNEERTFVLRNHGKTAVKFEVTVTQVTGSGVTVTAPSSVRVGARRDSGPITIGLKVPAAGVGPAFSPTTGAALFPTVSGYITLTPAAGSNGEAALTLPYLLVPRARSNGFAFTDGRFGPRRTTAKLYATNFLGQLESSPDFYTLGLSQPTPQGVKFADTRAVGVQSFATTTAGAPDQFLIFAVNTFGRMSNPAGFSEFDITINSSGTATPNWVLVGYNGSAFSSSASIQNRPAAALINLATGRVTVLRFAVSATDQSNLLLPVKASEIGVTPANPRFTYTESHFGPDGSAADMPGAAVYNPWTPALSVSFAAGTVAPGSYQVGSVSVNAAEWPLSTPEGILIINQDNPIRKQGQVLTNHP
jgi:subtilisin family serine protease